MRLTTEEIESIKKEMDPDRLFGKPVPLMDHLTVRFMVRRLLADRADDDKQIRKVSHQAYLLGNVVRLVALGGIPEEKLREMATAQLRSVEQLEQDKP